MDFRNSSQNRKAVKLSQIAAPTLNSISKAYLHYFRHFLKRKKVGKVEKKLKKGFLKLESESTSSQK